MDIMSLNRYIYVKNNPMCFKDPTGHFGENVFDDGAAMAPVLFAAASASYIGLKEIYDNVAALLAGRVQGRTGPKNKEVKIDQNAKDSKKSISQEKAPATKPANSGKLQDEANEQDEATSFEKQAEKSKWTKAIELLEVVADLLGGL